MTGERTPWWYSGGEEPASEPQGSVDWTGLLAGAARMVDWATSSVLAPHADHTDPREHPDCVVCRTIALVGDPGGLGANGPAPSPPGERHAAEPIRWIPVVDAADAER